MIDQFNLASAAGTTSIFSPLNPFNPANLANPSLPSGAVNIATEINVRNLQLLQNYTVYNYKKTLFSKTIFGKTFSADVDVKCYVLVYSNDHQIQCIGSFNY